MSDALAHLTLARWPRVTGAVRPDGTGTLSVNDQQYACAATSPDRLYVGVLARGTVIARTMGRPVRVHVSDATGSRLLAVHADGRVQAVLDDGRLDAAQTVPGSPCRRCGTDAPLAAATCASCGTLEPHRVELSPVAVLDAATLAQPDEALAEQLDAVGPALPLTTPPALQTIATARPVSTSATSLPVLRARPLLRLSFDSQPGVTLDGSASLGRAPSAIADRQPVPLTSPGMLVSKTHAFIDLDDDGLIRVTDCNSTNGTVVHAGQAVRLAAWEPVVVAPGTTLTLGDVACTVDLEG
ncbi:FHA domain-containing protein [Cellulomonas sp. URHE0023]|uniref:FHA domain-containing protein n=1 Tax=Cellulomonas sp. URHE0023 TaxID=1380354 RepID=UPI00054F3BDD|nr:FHA domain-containing protein [Cellulomonas sp. URHE0023]